MGRLDAIFLKPARREPMQPIERADLVAGRGIAGNANQGGRRQVTLLERERWDAAMLALGGALPPHARRANLLVCGVALPHTRGRVLRVGACRIRILGETTPCSRMDDAMPGLKDVLAPEWGGGAFGEVLDDGVVAVGDPIAWEDGPSGDAG